MQAATLLELRTSRESADEPKVAEALFHALPQKGDGFLRRSSVSFEISSLLQTTRFMVRVPTKHESYMQALVTSAHQNALVSVPEYDPVETLKAWHSHANVAPAVLEVKPSVLSGTASIKSLAAFADADSLAPLLSYFAKSDPETIVVLQIVLKAKKEHRLLKAVSKSVAQSTTAESETDTKPADAANQALLATIRFGIWTPTAERTQSVIDALSAIVLSWSADLSHPLSLNKPLRQAVAFKKLLERKPGKAWSITPGQAASLFHLPHKELSAIHNIHWGKLLPGEPPENLPIVAKGMDAEARQELNVMGKTLFKNEERVFAIKRADRRRHIYVIGKTGTGKSTLLANMAINDLKNDEGICVIDPHGDLVETLLDYIPARRINDVIYFDPADTGKTVKINLFEGENLVHRELIASGIVSVFYKLYGYSWGPRLEYILRNALLTLLTAQSARLSDITRLLTDKKFRDKITENLEDPVLANFWKNEFDNLQDRLRNEAIAPILNKVGQFVSSPMIRNVVDAHKSSFSLEQAMNEGKIILVNLSQGKLGEDNATLIGAMLITKIQLAAMSRVYQDEADRKDFFLYVDEFQNFATQSFIKILSEARKYRLNLTLANQYIAQIPEEVQKAIFGNCGSMLSFVMGAEDAALFSKEFNSMYSETDLVSLSKHQVITKLTIDNVISHPFPAYTLPLAASSNQNRPKVLKVSKERYAA